MLNYMTVKNMRSIKKQILLIFIKVLENCNSLDHTKANFILKQIIFPLGDLLEDFNKCIAETKEQEFVSLFTVVLEKFYLVIDA